MSAGPRRSRRSIDIGGRSEYTLPDYVSEILASGFPGIRALPGRARRAQLTSYLSRIVQRELPDNGVMVRRPGALRAWLAAYGAATATDASYSVILDAATAGVVDKPARQTIAGYRDHLERLFILDPLPAWTPAITRLKRLTDRIVITTGEFAYRRPDGVAVIPLALLGP